MSLVLISTSRSLSTWSSAVGLQHSWGFFNGIRKHVQKMNLLAGFAWKNAAIILSLGNMIMGLFSIFCSFNRKPNSACWLLLISFLFSLASGPVARQLGIYSNFGTKINDFAEYTSFGFATALLLMLDGTLSGILAIFYVLAVFYRLCWYSFEIPFAYQGLPCSYASSLLVSTFLLTNGNKLILFGLAVLMMSFMVDKRFYPNDKTLESQFWKKVVFTLGAMMLWHSLYMTPLYFLIWSSSYIFFPGIWGKKVIWPPAPEPANPPESASAFTE
ncbi:transmembrane protein 269 [Gracilinanus agilis]|uniref:transmembrane protein 269 n=1 Tax=Gracilinanus agilis TaxID=191870 RepID=UPI001CFEA2E8|nr:transmembrane protein 269 [Gracilinanus agilis]